MIDDEFEWDDEKADANAKNMASPLNKPGAFLTILSLWNGSMKTPAMVKSGIAFWEWPKTECYSSPTL